MADLKPDVGSNATNATNATNVTDYINALDTEIQQAVITLGTPPCKAVNSMGLPQSEGSSVIFVCRPPGGMCLGLAKAYIPTLYLREKLETHCCTVASQYCLDLFCTLSSHALTRTGADWAHGIAMHNRLDKGGMALVIFGSDGESTMQPSNCILPGTLRGLKQVQ